MQIDMNRFDEIQHTPLRVYNRTVVAFNLMEDYGQPAVVKYLELFSEDEKKQIVLMNQFIKSKGKEAAHKFAIRDLKVDDYEEEEHVCN